jgi:hypothetical protein
MALPVSVPIGQSTIVVNAAVGNAAQGAFTFQPLPGGGKFNAVVQATGTFSACSAALGISLDGGTTWSAYITAADFAATPVQLLTDLIAGALYRYTTSGFTGTSITLSICRN